MEGVHPPGVGLKAVGFDYPPARVNHDISPDLAGKVLVEESTDEDNVDESTFVEKVAQVMKKL